MTTIEILTKFVNQRPGLDFCNYGDIKLYRSEMTSITKDLHDFRELSAFFMRRVENFNDKLEKALKDSNRRLTMTENGNLQYCTGQYFPTEYRPAANRILADLIWADFRSEKNANGELIYPTGNEIRAAIRRNVSRRVFMYYFN